MDRLRNDILDQDELESVNTHFSVNSIEAVGIKRLASEVSESVIRWARNILGIVLIII